MFLHPEPTFILTVSVFDEGLVNYLVFTSNQLHWKLLCCEFYGKLLF